MLKHINSNISFFSSNHLQPPRQTKYVIQQHGFQGKIKCQGLELLTERIVQLTLATRQETVQVTTSSHTTT